MAEMLTRRKSLASGQDRHFALSFRYAACSFIEQKTRLIATMLAIPSSLWNNTEVFRDESREVVIWPGPCSDDVEAVDGSSKPVY